MKRLPHPIRVPDGAQRSEEGQGKNESGTFCLSQGDREFNLVLYKGAAWEEQYFRSGSELGSRRRRARSGVFRSRRASREQTWQLVVAGEETDPPWSSAGFAFPNPQRRPQMVTGSETGSPPCRKALSVASMFPFYIFCLRLLRHSHEMTKYE